MTDTVVAPYEALRSLVSPIVLVTTSTGEEKNGLIVNSALRASLSPEKLRLSVIIHKFNHSHDLIVRAGVFAAHILRTDQIDMVVRFGTASGRDTDKFAGLDYRTGGTGCPIVDDCFAVYECRIVNAMDTGASTFFLGAVESTGGQMSGAPMSSQHVRQGMPSQYSESYEAELLAGQEFSTRMLDRMQPLGWPIHT
jgi:flavin reductase (DIM6/NTAB) family NADH-FMN oxidoreductase RutF